MHTMHRIEWKALAELEAAELILRQILTFFHWV